MSPYSFVCTLRRYSLRAATLAAVSMALIAVAPWNAAATLTFPDPADDYVAPFLYAAHTDPEANFVVPSFDTAPDGKLWVFHRDAHEIADNFVAVYEQGQSTSSATKMLPGRWLNSMSFGPDGLLYATDLTSTGETQTVVVFDPADMSVDETFGAPEGEAYYLENPSDILVDGAGNVYALNQGPLPPVRFDAVTREPTVFEQPLDADIAGPRGMCFDANGDILVADTYNARLVRYDTSGVVLGTVDLSETPVTEPLDVYQDGFGTTYVLGQSPTSSQFIRLDADGDLMGTYPNPAEGSISTPPSSP